jgi:hypothetical protein
MFDYFELIGVRYEKNMIDTTMLFTFSVDCLPVYKKGIIMAARISGMKPSKKSTKSGAILDYRKRF